MICDLLNALSKNVVLTYLNKRRICESVHQKGCCFFTPYRRLGPSSSLSSFCLEARPLSRLAWVDYSFQRRLHSPLFCASSMLSPLLLISSFTTSLQVFFGLPLLLLPKTFSSHTLITFVLSILSIWPSYLSLCSARYFTTSSTSVFALSTALDTQSKSVYRTIRIILLSAACIRLVSTFIIFLKWE